MIWNNTRWSAGHVLKVPGSTLSQWKEAQKLQPHAVSSCLTRLGLPTRWERAGTEWVKVNVNVAVFGETRSIGIGCVLRNSSGHFLLAITIPIQQQLGPKEAEVVGVREALSWVKQKNLTNVIVETDSQLVFNAVKKTSLATSPLLC